jgi:PAS domain S-box-containing protein
MADNDTITAAAEASLAATTRDNRVGMASRSANVEMRHLMEKRTAELSEANRLLDESIERRRQLEADLLKSETRFRRLTELSPDWYWEQDEEFRSKYLTDGTGALMNGAMDRYVGFGQRRWDIPTATPLHGTWDEHKAVAAAHLPFHEFEYQLLSDDGRTICRSISGEPVFDAEGKFRGYRGIGRDITAHKVAEAELLRRNAELTELNDKLSTAQQQLVQAEKLASIGQLAAGVAHEINNPIGYIFSNFGTLQHYLEGLFEMLSAYEEAESGLGSTMVTKLQELRKHVELEFLKDDIPTLMEESKEGLTRVRKIVQDLKDFSRVDSTKEWQWANVHQGIDSTINIVNNEVKYKADVVKEYGDIPDIECLPSQLNQVIMNLLVNAAHAMGDQHGKITIRTGAEGDNIWIDVADNGHGIPKEIQSRIFDPFFTTKPIGKGTGLGLSLSYGIVQKHRGRIELQSEVGKGTTFRITLPIRHTLEGAAEADKR